MVNDQRSPQDIRDMVIAALPPQHRAAITVPLPEPSNQMEMGPNWKMTYTGDPQLFDVFNGAVQHVQRQWDAHEDADTPAGDAPART